MVYGMVYGMVYSMVYGMVYSIIMYYIYDICLFGLRLVHGVRVCVYK